MDTEQRAQQMLEHARDDVKHADQKASLLFAVLGVGFGAIVGGQLSGGWSYASLPPKVQICLFIGGLAASLAVVAAGLAVWPRYRTNDRPTYGVTYWGHIASLGTPADVKVALEQPDETDGTAAYHQLWSLSRLVLKKYFYVRTALLLAALSGVILALGSFVLR
jgi:hypothetical protein